VGEARALDVAHREDVANENASVAPGLTALRRQYIYRLGE
jgi:hypothetical protein